MPHSGSTQTHPPIPVAHAGRATDKTGTKTIRSTCIQFNTCGNIVSFKFQSMYRGHHTRANKNQNSTLVGLHGFSVFLSMPFGDNLMRTEKIQK